MNNQAEYKQDYKYIEFAFFYKRLICVENFLKTKIISTYIKSYGKNVFKVTYNYFNTIKNRRLDNDSFVKIFNSETDGMQKFELLIKKLYLSELLNFFRNPVFLKNKVKKNFFEVSVKTNAEVFQKMSKYLKEFRNAIAHFDEKKITTDKKIFVKSLIYFEKLLNYNSVLDFSNIENIEFGKKLSTKDILNIIYKLKPEYFKNDKLLIPLFDDIAYMVGYTYEGLPQRWSIIRQKFTVESECRTKNSFEDNKYSQISLNLDDY